MEERKYCVVCDNTVLASGMILEVALTLVWAIFEKLWSNETELKISIRREDKGEDE